MKYLLSTLTLILLLASSSAFSNEVANFEGVSLKKGQYVIVLVDGVARYASNVVEDNETMNFVITGNRPGMRRVTVQVFNENLDLVEERTVNVTVTE